LTEIKPEIYKEILSVDHEYLLVQFLTAKKFEHVGVTTEGIALFQRLAKNYPYYLIEAYPHLNSFVERVLGSIDVDKKRVTMVLKILEEWLKCYKSKSLISNEDEEEHGDVDTEDILDK
jgi:hypothetical protein